jgi:uracil-DNA glycosylase
MEAAPAREQQLEEAAIAAAACRKCAIGYERRNNVYGEGDPHARLMVVGEGPGETEDQLGRPFVGRAGQLLDRMLAAIGLERGEVYICNTVKCRPTVPGPNGELPPVSGRTDGNRGASGHSRARRTGG